MSLTIHTNLSLKPNFSIARCTPPITCSSSYTSPPRSRLIIIIIVEAAASILWCSSPLLYIILSAAPLSARQLRQKYGLLCGSDGLPHLIVRCDQRHWGEFITPGILFLYIAGWIGWVGRSELLEIAIRDEKKPTQKEIIIDVPLASKLLFRGFGCLSQLTENGELVAKDI